MAKSESYEEEYKEMMKNMNNSKSQNNFLFSSLNLESVCSVLSGLHKVVQHTSKDNKKLEQWIEMYKKDGQEISFSP